MARLIPTSIDTFDAFRDALVAYRLPRVIISALELDLFTVIGSRAWSIGELAKTLDVSTRGLDILCRNLAMCGLLKKRGASYRNSRLAATELNGHHPKYRGAYLELLKSHWEDWSRLTEAVQSGLPVDHGEPEEPGYRRRFTWAMHHRSLEVAPKVVQHINLKYAKTLLDLGGGPATYALAFLDRNPTLRATVCDRQEALDVAREIAATHKAGNRLSYLSADFIKEPLVGTYDVVWYSNVLHIYSPEQNQAIFGRIRSALTPGGRVIIQDAFLHDREGLHPEDASLFAVTMLLFTESGNTYSIADTGQWLKRAGFTGIRLIKMKKGTEDWEGGLLEAKKPG